MAKLTREDFISALKEMTILEVKELVDAGKVKSIEEAIDIVFGHFELSYTINGFKCALSYEVDADELMKELIIV